MHRDQGAIRAALHHCVATDDARLVLELAAANVAFDGTWQGSALATDMAIGSGAFAAAEALVRVGAPVAVEALARIDGPAPATLVEALLAKGAVPDVAAIVKCAACGATEGATLIARSCGRAGVDLPAAFAAAREAALEDLRSTLHRVQQGKAGHYLKEEGLAQRIEWLERFELP